MFSRNYWIVAGLFFCLWPGLAVWMWDALRSDADTLADSWFSLVIASFFATWILSLPAAVVVVLLLRFAKLIWYDAVPWIRDDRRRSSVAILMLCLWAGLLVVMLDADAMFVSVLASFLVTCILGLPVAFAAWLFWRIRAVLAHRRGGMGRGDLVP